MEAKRTTEVSEGEQGGRGEGGQAWGRGRGVWGREGENGGQSVGRGEGREGEHGGGEREGRGRGRFLGG